MCSIFGCDSSRRGSQLFKLPEDPDRRLEWVQFLFEVNGQQLRESSWTDITICREHFTVQCLDNVTPESATVQLKSGAVPTLCIKDTPETDQLVQESVETTYVDGSCDQRETQESPSSCSEQSGLTSVGLEGSPGPCNSSDALIRDYGQMLDNIVNLDMVREKATLMQMEGKYVVNEMRLLQLFGHECPLCGSKVKVEKVTYGVLFVLNRLCLQCEYTKQWKSQVDASVPTAKDQQLTEITDVTSLIQQTVSTDIADIPSVHYEEVDYETSASEDEDAKPEVESDEDWIPQDELFLENELCNDLDEESEQEGDDDAQLAPHNAELCTDCGAFFNKARPHACVHKIRPFSCNICGKRCVSEIALTAHSRIHSEDHVYPCKYCHAPFKTKVDKVNHEKTHCDEEKPYKCPECPDTFARNKQRRFHSRCHKGPRQFICPICGIDYHRINNTQIKRHMDVHTGMKAYVCKVCQRGFKQASHLKSHMRVHTGERPYKCRHCNQSFNHNVSLKSHVQRYHTDVVIKENGNNVEGEEDERKWPKRPQKYTGRPAGRPKRKVAVAGNDKGSNTKNATSKVRKSKKTVSSEEESNISFDSAEGEEEEKEMKSSKRPRPEKKHNDPDFDPEQETKKKRYSSRGRAKKSGSDSDFDPQNSP